MDAVVKMSTFPEMQRDLQAYGLETPTWTPQWCAGWISCFFCRWLVEVVLKVLVVGTGQVPPNYLLRHNFICINMRNNTSMICHLVPNRVPTLLEFQNCILFPDPMPPHGSGHEVPTAPGIAVQ